MVRRLEEQHERVRLLGFMIFLGLAFTLLFPYFESTRNANERPRLMQGMALVDAGTFAIDGPVSRRLDPGPDVARSPEGRLYPNKPPGTSIVLAVAYAGARAIEGDALTLRTYTWWARILTGAVPTLVLCAFMVLRLSRGFGRGPAIGAVALYALATPANSYAHLAYGHQLAAALLLVGLALVVDAVEGAPDGDRRGSRSGVRAAIGGALAAAAVTVEYGAVFAGVPMAVLLARRAREARGHAAAGWAISGAIVPIVALAAYHHHAFGSPFATGYHHAATRAFAEKHGQGLLGLSVPSWDGFHTHFLSADGGLLWWAPLVPLSVYGLARVATSDTGVRRTEARVYLSLLGVYVLVTSGLVFDGGWRVGPRYMVVVLPALALGWAEVLGQIRTHAVWLALVIALGTYAVCVNTLAANLWPHFDLDNVHQPVAEVLLPLWDRGLEPHGLLRAWFGVDALGLTVGLTVAGALWALCRLAEPTIPNVLAIVGGIALGVVGVGATKLAEPHPKGGRNLAYIVRQWEPAPGSHVDAHSASLPRPPRRAASPP